MALYNCCRNLVLHSEHLLDIAVVPFSPDMIACFRVDKLCGDANAATAATHAAFQHVAHAQLTGHLLYVNRATLVGKAGIARDHKQRTAARKLGDDVISDAVREILLIWSPLILVKASTAIDGLSGSGRLQSVSRTSDAARRISALSRSIEPHHESLNRSSDVLQIERPKFLERQIEPVMHMIAHRSRDADAARRTFGLKSRRHIHHVAVQVSPIGNRVADVDPDAEADGPIRGLVAIVDRNLLLHLHGTAHRSVDAVEHDEQGIAPGLDDPAAMLLDRRVDQVSCGEPAAVRASQRRPVRSDGCSRPCRHRRRRPASADLAASRYWSMPRSALPARLSQTIEHVFVIFGSEPRRAAMDVEVERFRRNLNCLAQRCRAPRRSDQAGRVQRPATDKERGKLGISRISALRHLDRSARSRARNNS